MATPYGHALAGLGLLNLWFYPSHERRPLTLYGWVVLGACLPDLDFIPGLLMGQGGRFHHGISHSLGLVLAASMLLWVVMGLQYKSLNFFRMGGLVFCLTISHLLLDFFTESPKGFPLFWPLTESSFRSPLPIFPRVERSWGHPQLRDQAWLCFWVETFLLAPLWITSLRYSGQKPFRMEIK